MKSCRSRASSIRGRPPWSARSRSSAENTHLSSAPTAVGSQPGQVSIDIRRMTRPSCHRRRRNGLPSRHTARARFGPPLRVTGVQHPAPPLSCEAFRTRGAVIASAPYATPVYEGRSLLPSVPATNIWVLLYAQVTQADSEDHRNILLSRRPAPLRRKHDRGRPTAPRGDARWSQAEIEAVLASLGLPKSSPLSVLAVELLPEVNHAADPLGADLGTTRVLRTSRLVPVPPVCVQAPCPM
jgi:hypothetical protein